MTSGGPTLVPLATLQRALELSGFIQQAPDVFTIDLDGELWVLAFTADGDGNVAIRDVLRSLATQIPGLSVEVRNAIARNFDIEPDSG